MLREIAIKIMERIMMQNHSIIQPIFTNHKSHNSCVCTRQLTFIRVGHKDPGEPRFWQVRPPEEQGSQGQDEECGHPRLSWPQPPPLQVMLPP